MTSEEEFELRALAAAGLALAEQAIMIAQAIAVQAGLTINFASFADTLRSSDPVGATGDDLRIARGANEIAARVIERMIG